MNRLAELDLKHCWHPFTDQEQWEQAEPLVVERGEGVWLYDTEGGRYLDANSSIWTNIHGHSHPVLVKALQKQAAKLCHSSYLGLANDQASLLAEKLCSYFPEGTLSRCFFSDDGSTALEVAFKMSLQWRQQNGEEGRTAIIAFENAYHGDTLGAASVGGVSRFIKGYGESGLEVYRVASLADLKALPQVVVETASALVLEPLIQGVNQMKVWPKGMLKEVRDWTSLRGIDLILDEVMTGFGRTGKMFACHEEKVIPDFLCLAKGLTGGTMPLAATLTSSEIYEGFRGDGKTFYYGHSYTGNALGCAVALANLGLFEKEGSLENARELGVFLEAALERVSGLKNLRRVGLILAFEVGIEGKVFCDGLRAEGVLTRPILNTIVLMPPLAMTRAEGEFLIQAVRKVAKNAEQLLTA